MFEEIVRTHNAKLCIRTTVPFVKAEYFSYMSLLFAFIKGIAMNTDTNELSTFTTPIKRYIGIEAM